MEATMRPMRFYLDTHDHRSKTFPAGISTASIAPRSRTTVHAGDAVRNSRGVA
jgi:hypothetical protein